MVCIGTKRGVNYGLVYDAEGVVIGRVFRDSKVARAALGGGRRSFYTAHAIIDGVETTASLGTRHETRSSAVAAIRAFHASYPADVIRRAAGQAPFDLYANDPGARLRMAIRRALSAAAAQFKYDHWRVCGLSQRNLTDPRASRWHIHVPQEV
jgi:hypothetical protein